MNPNTPLEGTKLTGFDPIASVTELQITDTVEGTGEVAVAREAQPATLRVADPHPLHHRWRRRTVRLAGLAPHQTGVSGRIVRPVGPTCVSVPIPGQTPQS